MGFLINMCLLTAFVIVGILLDIYFDSPALFAFYGYFCAVIDVALNRRFSANDQ